MEPASRSTRRWVVGVLAAVIFSLPVAVFAVVVSTNIYFVEEGVVEAEDVYVAATSARVFGTIDGDLVVAAGDVTIAGVVTGDVLVATQGSVDISGTVEGSVRGLARDISVSGTVRGDVAAVAFTIGVTGSVERDVLLLAASLDHTGDVGRDILGRVQSADLDGEVGGDVDILVSRLALGPGLDVAGDIIYRSESDAAVSAEAEVAGSLSRLPTRGSFIVRSVLLFVNVIHFLSFVFAGLLLLWLFQPSTSATVSAIIERPFQAMGVGLIALIVAPVVIVLLVFSLIGIPVGVLLLLVLVLSLFFSPIPAVTALGHRLLRGRGALFGGFVLGAVVWRGALWLLPWIALVLYGLSVAAGLGGFIVSTYRRRRTDDSSIALVPESRISTVVRTETEASTPDGWEPPLAPVAGTLEDAPFDPVDDDEEDES